MRVLPFLPRILTSSIEFLGKKKDFLIIRKSFSGIYFLETVPDYAYSESKASPLLS